MPTWGSLPPGRDHVSTGSVQRIPATDCDDMTAATFPGAPETPDDGVDQDCSGADTITCFVDADMDGFGTDEGTTTLAADGSCDTADMEATTATVTAARTTSRRDRVDGRSSGDAADEDAVGESRAGVALERDPGARVLREARPEVELPEVLVGAHPS